jgi:cell division protein FtsB
MNPELLLSLISALSVFILGILQWRANARSADTQILKVNTETILALSRRIDELERRDEENARRIDELERENRELRRAIARAVEYIRRNYPGADIPDFTIPTGPLKPLK